MNPTVDALVLAAQSAGGTVVQTPAATIIVIPLVRAVDLDELLPLEAAARVAGTSPRALRDAARRGELRLLGRERSRVVRRRDVLGWVETRTSPIVAVDGGQGSRVELRLARVRRQGSR